MVRAALTALLALAAPPGASASETYWRLSVQGEHGEAGFVSRLTAVECACLVSHLLAGTGGDCQTSAWEADLEVVTVSCEAYQQGTSIFAPSAAE